MQRRWWGNNSQTFTRGKKWMCKHKMQRRSLKKRYYTWQRETEVSSSSVSLQQLWLCSREAARWGAPLNYRIALSWRSWHCITETQEQLLSWALLRFSLLLTLQNTLQPDLRKLHPLQIADTVPILWSGHLTLLKVVTVWVFAQLDAHLKQMSHQRKLYGFQSSSPSPSTLAQFKNQNNPSTSIKSMTQNYPFEVTEGDGCFVKSFPDLSPLWFTLQMFLWDKHRLRAASVKEDFGTLFSFGRGATIKHF